MNTPDTTLFCSEEKPKLAPALKVSELVALLKTNIESSHKNIRVIGEITSFKQWQSGHCYFDIKDENALIPAVMFKPFFVRVPFKIKDGLEILFSGRISVYAANARLQMIVENMEPLGEGALAFAFMQLKEKLQKKGFFDAAHKKTLKKINNNIGIVTSKQGAALRDMLRIIYNRWPGANILLAPARVQGLGAKEEIAAQIKNLDQCNVDLIIVGRGGGSLEDLWAFNEEIVAQAIFDAKTPIISAVGHETDTTISDFVADLRAATPTHAAMLATPDLQDLLEYLEKAKNALYDKKRMILNSCALKLAEQKKRIQDPRILLFRHWQRLDEFSKEIKFIINNLIKKQKIILASSSQQLQSYAPYSQLRVKKEALAIAKTRLSHNIFALLRNKRSDYENCVVKLAALSPLAVLSRGFAVVKDSEQGHVVSSISQVEINNFIKIRLNDGYLSAKIKNKEHL